MALGDVYTGGMDNNSREEKDKLTVYCPVMFRNPDAECDPSRLSWSIWKNRLKLTISPKNDSKPGDTYVTYSKTDQGEAYLNVPKAMILKERILDFLEDPMKYNNVGISTGANLVSVSNGIEYGVSSPVLSIRKIDQNGAEISNYAYQFGKADHFAIVNYDSNSATYDTLEHANLELEYFVIMLDEYIKSSTYMAAYTVAKTEDWNMTRLKDNMASIMDKLGLKTSNQQQPSFFDNANKSHGANNYSNGSSSAAGKTATRSMTTFEELEGDM